MAELSSEIELFLRGEAVMAGKHSRPYRIRKSLRRHRAAATLSGLAAVVGVIVIVTLMLTNRRIRINREDRTYEWDNTRIDLLNDRARIEVFELVATEGRIPRQAGARPEDLESYRTGFASLAPVERQCLVFETPGGSIWLSPRFGLLRLVEGKAVQDLICSKANE